MNEKEQISLKKDEIQNKAVVLSESHPSLLLSFATGVGKSLAAIKIIERNPEERWYILCKQTDHIDNWIKEFTKHEKEHLLFNVEIFCYDSLHKYVGTKANLVLDEGHAITELRLDLIKQIKSDKVVILSATVDIEKKMLLKEIKGNLREFHISISDAIKQGLLPPPKIYVVDIFLDEAQQKQYNKITASVDFFRQKHFQLQQEWTEYKWLGTALKRKVMLSNFKTQIAKQLLEKFRNKRLVCFTGSVDQCNLLGGENVVHSKTKNKKANQKLIDNFNNKKIDKLFAVNMLRESMNLTDIDLGIIIQLDNQKLSFIQMLGRVFRADLPECYVLVVRNTQDEVYLKTVLEGFDTKYIYKYQ